MVAKKQPSTLACVTQYRPPVHLEAGQQFDAQPGQVVERVHIQAKDQSEGRVNLEWNGETSKLRVYGTAWLTLEILGRYDWSQQFTVFNESAVNVVVELVSFAEV